MPSDDNVTVMIANLTGNALNPLSSTFEYGGFGSDPVTIPPDTQPAIEAFEVEGHTADGPQGTVSYNINNDANALFQFNVNVGGKPGDYFFAGLQPQGHNGNTSDFYLQVANFNMPPPNDQTSFTPTVTVYQNPKPPYQVTPISSPTPGSSTYLWELWVVNDTGGLMTLNQLIAPLNGLIVLRYGPTYSFQPWVATTLLPQSAPQLMAAAQCGTIPDEAKLNLSLVYNVDGNNVLTITYDWQSGSPAAHTMHGPNESGYLFASTVAYESQSGDSKLIQLTVTVSQVP